MACLNYLNIIWIILTKNINAKIAIEELSIDIGLQHVFLLLGLCYFVVWISKHRILNFAYIFDFYCSFLDIIIYFSHLSCVYIAYNNFLFL